MSDYIDEFLASQLPTDDLRNIVAYLLEEIKKLKQSKAPIQTTPPLVPAGGITDYVYYSMIDGAEDVNVTQGTAMSLSVSFSDSQPSILITMNEAGLYMVGGTIYDVRPAGDASPTYVTVFLSGLGALGEYLLDSGNYNPSVYNSVTQKDAGASVSGISAYIAGWNVAVSGQIDKAGDAPPTMFYAWAVKLA